MSGRWLVLVLIMTVPVFTGCQMIPGKNSSEQSSSARPHSVLVMHKTEKFHHKSIASGLVALEKIAAENNLLMIETDDASIFTNKGLSAFDAIIFLNTTGNILDDGQQRAMERFIRNGGGFVGVHAAADTEWRGDWHWYRKLVGAVFKSHPKKPNVQEGELSVVFPDHVSTQKLPTPHKRSDEWYNFRDYYGKQTVLITIDESSYHGGENGSYHPVSWYHEFDGGRAFYTAMGHTEESYADPYFLTHLLGGIQYVLGGK